MAHYISYGSLDRTYYLDNCGTNSRVLKRVKPVIDFQFVVNLVRILRPTIKLDEEVLLWRHMWICRRVVLGLRLKET